MGLANVESGVTYLNGDLLGLGLLLQVPHRRIDDLLDIEHLKLWVELALLNLNDILDSFNDI